MPGKYFFRFTAFIVAFYFLFAGLFYARQFFVPLVLAGILSMLVVPINQKLEKRGWNKPLATSISILVILICLAGFFWLLINQIESFSQDMQSMQKKITGLLNTIQQWVQKTFHISMKEQQKYLSSGTSRLFGFAKNFVTGFFATGADLLLTFVYIFCFLIYRNKLKEFVIKLVPDNKKEKTGTIIDKTSEVARNYLAGRLILILILAGLYFIGLTIIGLKNALFFSIFAAVFSLIPYIGNIIGFLFPASMALLSGGGAQFLGVVIVFSIAQFLESYILEPIIVGGKVNINPFFVIVGVIIGNLVWGVPGMVLAIPIIGILKILFENIPRLNPFGYLLAETEKSEFEEKMEKKITSWLNKLRNKD